MSKERSKLQKASEEVEKKVKLVNNKIIELGVHSHYLYKSLILIQSHFDKIRNVPNEKKLEYERIKNICLNWKQQVEKIENDYNKATKVNASVGAVSAGLGVGIVALGPTAAMGIATTFGVASTGTAISTLSGAAATNAALAWLGGGALAAGGGGMAAGNALIALAGPIGWTIAAMGIIGAGIFYWYAKSDLEKLENIFLRISKRDLTSYDLTIVEINERINRIIDETAMLNQASLNIETFGTDYNQMSEEQQYTLGAYVNLMNASTQLLVNPILGLRPKITENDYDNFVSIHSIISSQSRKALIVYLANLLYKIELNESERKLLVKSFKNNKEFLDKNQINKDDINLALFNIVDRLLNFTYVRKGDK